MQQHLLDLIKDDTFPLGEQLASEAELSSQLGISRPILREALDILLLPKDEPIDIFGVERVIAFEGKSVAYLKDMDPQYHQIKLYTGGLKNA